LLVRPKADPLAPKAPPSRPASYKQIPRWAARCKARGPSPLAAPQGLASGTEVCAIRFSDATNARGAANVRTTCRTQAQESQAPPGQPQDRWLGTSSDALRHLFVCTACVGKRACKGNAPQVVTMHLQYGRPAVSLSPRPAGGLKRAHACYAATCGRLISCQVAPAAARVSDRCQGASSRAV
jgi:hypothetical protein